jgi:hypothetical protein
MNQSIAKQQDKLRISASKWLTSSMNFKPKASKAGDPSEE